MLAVLGTLSLFLAFAPGPAWDAVTGVLGVVVRNPQAQLVAVLWVVVWISARFRTQR